MSAIIYLVRHGEVEHHRLDMGLTVRGHEQAKAAGELLATYVIEGDKIFFYHSPVTRVAETADLMYRSFEEALRQARCEKVVLHSPEPDSALNNVRFIVAPGRAPEEPSLLYGEMTKPEYMQKLSPTRAEFYRGFWSSTDPMGFWLTHASDGGAETPATVLARLSARLKTIFEEGVTQPSASNRRVYIMVTHSGTLRALLRFALGTDPGEPAFCEIVTLHSTGDSQPVTLTYRDRQTQIMMTP